MYASTSPSTTQILAASAPTAREVSSSLELATAKKAAVSSVAPNESKSNISDPSSPSIKDKGKEVEAETPPTPTLSASAKEKAVTEAGTEPPLPSASKQEVSPAVEDEVNPGEYVEGAEYWMQRLRNVRGPKWTPFHKFSRFGAPNGGTLNFNRKAYPQMYGLEGAFRIALEEKWGNNFLLDFIRFHEENRCTLLIWPEVADRRLLHTIEPELKKSFKEIAHFLDWWSCERNVMDNGCSWQIGEAWDLWADNEVVRNDLQVLKLAKLPKFKGSRPFGKLTKVDLTSDANAPNSSKVEHQNLVDSEGWAHVIGDKKSQAAVAKIVDGVNEEYKKKLEEKGEELKKLKQELEKSKLAQGGQAGASSTAAEKNAGR